ncbi:helix-turn-helix domain-containing protein [Undibacterium sp. Ji42W]|uniref:helix-turn-helix domain-containing protein n=1 Tax=Undibacterium sp. Ji42W TaxID=3413039 RepID=UPI003BF16D37
MKTIEYLNAAKKHLGVESDYALAKRLGVTKQAIGAAMSGKSTLSDETAVKVAQALGIHAGLVLLDMHRERAHTPELAGFWNEIAKGFLTLLLPAKRTLA